MVVYWVEENIKLITVAVIRLGLRDRDPLAKKNYPENVKHLVLIDAPEVAKVYGPEPTGIDIMFPNSDEEQICKTDLLWYSASRIGADGKVIGGTLNCKGTGRKSEVINGEVVKTPGIATYYRGQVIPESPTEPLPPPPTRPCLGELCPDFYDANGNQKCKMTMRLSFMLPLVNTMGVYSITTGDKTAIIDVHSQIALLKAQYRGDCSFIPLKLMREEHSGMRSNRKARKKEPYTSWPIKLRANYDFQELHGDKIRHVTSLKGKQLTIAPPSPAVGDGHEDLFPRLLEGQTEDEHGTVVDVRALTAEELLEDPDVKAAFEKIDKATGKVSSAKSRLIAVRLREKEANMKAAVLKAMAEKLEALAAASAQRVATQEAATPPEVKPPAESGGIL